MAKTGDSYRVRLKEPHLNWGEYRNATNRESIEGEGYIPIPRGKAEEFNIYNSNNSKTGLGYNEFYASSDDGFLDDVVLLAQGCSEKGDVYAKQFSIEGDLKKIGSWYKQVGATTANSVEVTWLDSQNILLKIV